MSCPNDTDHDGDCQLCHRLPGGCFLRVTVQFVECPRPTTDTREFIEHLIQEISAPHSQRFTTSD